MRRAAVLAFVSSALACSPPEPQEGFALRIAAPGDLAPLHPLAKSTFTTAAVDLVYRPVLRVDERGEVVPGAVRRWEAIGSDRARVQIDPDLKFSDGSPVRAEDLVASLGAAGLQVRSSGEWFEIGAGSSRDPLAVTLLYTVVFKASGPVPLGTGPFAFVEGDARHLVLRRTHPAPGRIARVEIRAAPTPRDAFAWALRGEVSAVVGLDDRQSELMEGVPGLRIVGGESPHAVAVVMNAARLDREERLALASSVPVGELARAYGGRCVRVDGYDGGESVPAGRPLLVAAPAHDPGLPRVALSLRRALGPRGGDLAVEAASRSAKRMTGGDFDLFVTTVVAWPPVVLGW
ncbi:MAG TPA: hypothetical protein VFI16_02120, partial [Anaeromyxobacteraceae bacterium]|nr:hypothetical protein [Anaeromyxobacteraceae bacterium]